MRLVHVPTGARVHCPGAGFEFRSRRRSGVLLRWLASFRCAWPISLKITKQIAQFLIPQWIEDLLRHQRRLPQPYRRADHEIGLNVMRGQRLEHTNLDCAEAPTAVEHVRGFLTFNG
jgi:hypothetical protein